MLAIRYKKPGEKEVTMDLSPKQYEQITDEDIFETLGIKGVCLELRKVVNVFQSEDEFVNSMSLPLCDCEAELYLQDEFDEHDNAESNNAYVVFCAKDVAKLLEISVMDATKYIYEVATNLEELIPMWVYQESVVSCSTLLYMICAAVYMKDDYGKDLYNIIEVVTKLRDIYYADSNRRLVDEESTWKDSLRMELSLNE